MSVFKTLQAIDCSEHTEKKGKFTYLSWAWAWAILKENYPESTFHKWTFNHEGCLLPYMIAPDGYAYVKASVTVEGLELAEIMPVLNHQNKSVQNPTSFDVNTSLQRCLVKALAFHGLGLYIYAGEDLPPIEVLYVSENDLKVLRESITACNTDESAFCNYLKVSKLEDLPLVNLAKAHSALSAKKIAMAKEEA